MALIDGEILAVKFCQKFMGKDVCMVWTITTENPTGAVDLTWLLQKIRDYIGPSINQMQSTLVSNQMIRVDSITNPLRFATLNWTGAGGNAGEHLPSFAAIAIRLERGSKITRVGAKRVPGLSEGSQTDGKLTSSFKTSVSTNLAPKFASGTLLGTNPDTVQIAPVIVGKTPTGAYDLSRVQPVTGFFVSDYVTTQNSRKVR